MGMGKQPGPDSPSFFISVDAAASPSSSGMGSASPGLSGVPPSRLLLPPDTVLRTGLEKVAVGAGAMGPERRDWSPSPPATPEQGLSTFYLSYFDMLYSEDSSWVAKGPGASTREEPPDEPEQCPVIDSQAPGGSLDLAPGELTLEEHSLEQVQTMVVGEVLKDIETACKLLNITAGEPLLTPPSARGTQASGGHREVWGHRLVHCGHLQRCWCFHTYSQPLTHSSCKPGIHGSHSLCAPTAPAQCPHLVGAG